MLENTITSCCEYDFYAKTRESPYLGNGASDQRNEKRRQLLKIWIPPIKIPQNSPQKPLLATRKWFFVHCYVQNAYFLKTPLLGGGFIHQNWPKTIESTVGLFRTTQFPFPGHVSKFIQIFGALSFTKPPYQEIREL